jgi:hypothetical protein
MFAGAFHGGDAAFVAAWARAGIFICVPGVRSFQVAAAPTQSTRSPDEIGSVTVPGARDLGPPHHFSSPRWQWVSIDLTPQIQHQRMC